MICRFKKTIRDEKSKSQVINSMVGINSRQYFLELMNYHVRKKFLNFSVQRKKKKQKQIEEAHFFGNKLGIVLVFHLINSEKSDITTISFKNFNYVIKKYANLWKPLNELESGGIFITFDDGYIEQYTLALPILQAEHAPASFFVPIDSINQSGYLTENQIRKISNNKLFNVGAHALTHAPISPGSRVYSKQQIYFSSKILNEITSKRVRYFAYPWGGLKDFSRREQALVKRSKYEYAFSTLCCPFSKEDVCIRTAIPRIQMSNSNFLDVIKLIDTFLLK